MNSAKLEAGVQNAVYARADAFYRREISILQGRRYREWLAVLEPSIAYRVPTQTSIGGGEHAESDRLGYYDETYSLLQARIEKLESAFSWVERPPSTLRYFVQLLDAWHEPDGSIVTRANLLLFQYRWNLEQSFSGERHDRFADRDGDLRLAERTVYLDRAHLGAQGLSVIF